MNSDRPPPEPPDRVPAAAQPEPQEHREERFGPLEVTRLRKADGRSLIVYERVEPPA
jgi:hypothetical protein